MKLLPYPVSLLGVGAFVVMQICTNCIANSAFLSEIKAQEFKVLEFSWKGVPKRFFWSTESTLWGEAQVKCEGIGQHLVSVKTLEAQKQLEFIMEFYGITGQNWISLHRNTTSDPWTWRDGSRVTFENWYPGEDRNRTGGGAILGLDYSEFLFGVWTTPNYDTEKFKFLCE